MSTDNTTLCTKCKERPRKPNYFRCGECLADAHRDWCKRNPDRVKLYRRAESSSYYRNYYKANREQLQENLKTFYEENPNAKIAYALNRKAKRYGKSEKIKPADIDALYAAQPTCVDCTVSEPSDLAITYRFPLVHKLARNTPDNLIRQCKVHAKQQGHRLHLSIFSPELEQTHTFWRPE